MAFFGKHTFREFMGSEERITTSVLTTSVLTDRLAALTAQGILTKRPDPGIGARIATRSLRRASRSSPSWSSSGTGARATAPT